MALEAPMSRGLQASVSATVFSMGCRPTVRPRGADDGARARHALARASSLMGPGVLLSGGCRGRLWQAFVWALRPRTSVAPATPTLARRDALPARARASSTHRPHKSGWLLHRCSRQARYGYRRHRATSPIAP